MFKLMKSLCSVFLFAACAAQAMPVLQIEDGKLAGVIGLAVNSKVYDIRFVDGSCNSLFDGCNPDSFAFRHFQAASNAASALAHILQDEPYNSRPELTNGCTGLQLCHILTPYAVGGTHGPDTVTYRRLDNHIGGADLVSDWDVAYFNHDTSNSASKVWAVWTIATVPEPLSLILFNIGFLMIVIARFRKLSLARQI